MLFSAYFKTPKNIKHIDNVLVSFNVLLLKPIIMQSCEIQRNILLLCAFVIGLMLSFGNVNQN